MDSCYGGWPAPCYVDNPRIDKRQLPKLSLSEARRSWYLAPGEQALPVHDHAHEREFTAFLMKAIRGMESPGQMLIEMVFLDLREMLDRWYILNTLLEEGAHVPLYTSRVAAHQELFAEADTLLVNGRSATPRGKARRTPTSLLVPVLGERFPIKDRELVPA